MISDGHISKSELMLFLLFPIASKLFLVINKIMMERVNNSTPIALVLGMTGALGYLYILYRLLVRFGGKSLIHICQEVLGGVLGKCLALAFSGFFLAVTALRLREFSETISSVVLPTTPISAIIGTYTVLMVYATMSGMEAIARSARLLLPFVLIPAVVISLMVCRFAVPTRALPILDAPLTDIALTGGYATSFFAEIVLVGLLAPYLRKMRHALLGGVMGIVASTAAIVASSLLAVMVLTLRNAWQLQFPTVVLAALASVGTFVQRVESVYIFVWFFSAAITLSILFYATCLSSAEILGLKEYKPLAWPMAVIVYTLAFMPGNIVSSFNLDFGGIGIAASLLVLSIPVGLLALALVLGKRGNGDGYGMGDEGDEGDAQAE